MTPEPVNQPPAAGDAELPDRDLPLGGVVVIDLAGAFVDPENDSLVYGATASMPDVLLVGSGPASPRAFEPYTTSRLRSPPGACLNRLR